MELSSICWHSLFRIHIFPLVRVPSFNGVSMPSFTTKHGDLAPDPPGASGRGCPGNCGELATRVSSCTKDQEGSLWNHGGVVSSQQQEERFLDEISKNMCVYVFFFCGGGGGWQGIIGTMRCCVLDNYKRKQNMVPTVIEQDDFRFFYDIKWYPQVSLIEKTTHHKTSKSLGNMFQ